MHTVPNCAVLMATNVAIPWAFVGTSNFFNNLPQSETGATNDDEALTLGAAPTRYQYELGAWINMPGLYNNTIPHTYCWTDAGVAQISDMLAAFQRNWGEPFDDFGALGDQYWPATAHQITTFFALQSVYPDRIHLTGAESLKTAVTDPLGVNLQGRISEWVADAYSGLPTAARDAESVVDFVKLHITDTPWDQVPGNLTDGIWRRGQVETVGRYCIPPNPKRQFTRVYNVGRDASVGAVSDEALFVGLSSRAMVAEIPLGEYRDFPGRSPLWFKSGTAGTTDYAKFGAIEHCG